MSSGWPIHNSDRTKEPVEMQTMAGQKRSCAERQGWPTRGILYLLTR